MTRSKKRPAKAAPHMALDQPASIPLRDLILSPHNVRTIYEPEGIAELAADIQHRGLLQSLSVRPVMAGDAATGQFAVQSGGRRFRALVLLAERGDLPANAPIPCIVKTSGSEVSDSLAENSQRENLHPLDEFLAYKAMADTGLSDQHIAASHRVTVAYVRQRLRLSAASPVLLAAYRDQEIDLDQLMAYCLVDDHARQERVFTSVRQGHNDSSWYIKKLLTENTISLDDKRVRFVGVDAYAAAGGAVVRDLFDDEDSGFLQDADLLARLVDDKLATARAEAMAEGWKWVQAAVEIPYEDRRKLVRLTPVPVSLSKKQQKALEALTAERDHLDEIGEAGDLSEEQSTRYDELEAAIDGIEQQPWVYSPEDMARGGVLITLSYQGELSIDAGYITVNDLKAAVASDVATTDAATDNSESETSGKPLPERLVQDLTSYRTAALRNALAHDSRIAVIALLHAMALKQFYGYSAAESCLQVSTTRTFPATEPGLAQWPATTAFDERGAALKARLPADPDALWEALLAMDGDLRTELLAYCAAATVNAVREPNYRRTGAIGHANQVQMALGLHMTAAGWSTTAENFFNRVSKEQIIAAVREGKDDRTADLISHLKKAPMAQEAERLLKGTGWLPEPLRPVDPVRQDNELSAFIAGDHEGGDDDHPL